MRTRRLIGTAAAATLLLSGTAGAAVAAPVSTSSPESVYEIAATAPGPDSPDIESRAFPAALINAATALGRGFTAAKAPQQVKQMTRLGSGPFARSGTNLPPTSIDVIFDR